MERKSFKSIGMQVTEVELVYRNKVKAADRLVIKCSKDAADLLINGWNEGTLDLQESFKVLLLNRSNHVLGCLSISAGGVTATIADPRLIFAAALKANACSIILSHNHPSGSLRPSSADCELTEKFKLAGQLLDIKILDHLIITSEGYISFADEGLL